MPVDSLWLLARQPFVFPAAERLPHACKWEVFAPGRAGCLLCGAVHVCDPLTCRQQIATEDSLLCSITGVYLNKLYGSETWSDRSVCSGAGPKNTTELTYDVETHLHDLLLSKNAKKYALFEQNSYATRLSAAVEQGGKPCDCVADALAEVLQRVQWRVPPEFCLVERKRLVQVCTAAINTSVAMLFKNKFFKICRSNQKAIIFGLVYLLRTGVTNDKQVVLPQVPELCSMLPLEIHLRAFFGVNPSIITDTENRLKFLLRKDRNAQGHER